MATSQRAAGGSAADQGRLWGARARDFLAQEPKLLALYESVLDELGIGPASRLLDVGCGPGLFLRLAAQRGATVSGIDAAEPLIEIARERLPEAELVTGEMETLPFDDGTFSVVTGFTAFELAANPARALREARRVTESGAPIVIATWGPPELCEAAAWLRAMSALAPGPPEPFALSDRGALEAFAATGGLLVGERRDVLSVWDYPDAEAVLRAFASTGFTVEAIEIAGEERVDVAILAAVAPYRTSIGGYRLENMFSYVVARAATAERRVR